MRLTKFLVKVNMKIHQRRAISFSKKFIIDGAKIEKARKQELTKQHVEDSALNTDRQQQRESEILDKIIN